MLLRLRCEGDVNYKDTEIENLNHALCRVIEGDGDASDMIKAAGRVLTFSAAFCVVNRKGRAPVYLGDTYPDGAAKEAVQLYVRQTYLLNPIYNAFLDGLPPGIHRMIDLAPDNWVFAAEGSEVLIEDGEEIGYRTPGWPAGLQEMALTVDLGDGAMGELSFARPAEEGGFSSDLIDRLAPFYSLFSTAFRSLWSRQSKTAIGNKPTEIVLKDFASDILSPREAEIVGLILKGHSSLSISLSLGIALPTVKTHRKNAYSKLGISTQQQLFNAFLQWNGNV